MGAETQSELPDGGRAQLLPEARAAGSDDPQEQAEAILADSEQRTADPDPDDSQAGRRSSEETL